MTKLGRSHCYGKMSESTATTTTISSIDEEVEWEMRPGGMLVQKRNGRNHVSDLNVRLRIAYGALRFEIYVNSQATFGELKKVLAGETGLQVGDQRLTYRGKEKENREYLDRCGVKNGSKIILVEDPSSIERRYIEIRKNARILTAHRAISHVSMEVDKLVEQVSVIEKSMSNGVKVPEVQITTVIEMLMRQAVKLDNISTEGEASAQKSLQIKRVQKSVESLDVLKVSNARVKPVIVTTDWETFDPPSPTKSQWEYFY